MGVGDEAAVVTLQVPGWERDQKMPSEPERRPPTRRAVWHWKQVFIIDFVAFIS